jgi:hypothetical protein
MVLELLLSRQKFGRGEGAGVQEFRSSGVQEFRSSGVRSSGVQEFGSRESGVRSQEYPRVRVEF